MTNISIPIFRNEFVQNVHEIINCQSYLQNGLNVLNENINSSNNSQQQVNLNVIENKNEDNFQNTNTTSSSNLNTPKSKRKIIRDKAQNQECLFQTQLSNLDKLVKNHDKDGLKNFCRQGDWESDHPIRSKLWIQLTNFHRKSRSDHVLDPEYRDYSKIDKDLAEKFPRKLPSFVDTNFCRHFQLNQLGQIQLDRILWQIAADHPEMTYCPLLYPITALFLHYLTSEQTYSAISNLVDAETKSKTGKNQCLLPQTRTQIIKDAYVLLKLTNNFGLLKRKKFYEIQRSRLTKYYELDTCFLEWLKWIFIGLPFNHLIRIIDCFLIEGGKLLFRIGIAILILFKKHLDKKLSNINENNFQYKEISFANKLLRMFTNTQTDPGIELEINKVMNFCEQIVETPKEFMEVAFNISRFSSSKIEREYNNAEISLKQNHSLANLNLTLNLSQFYSPKRSKELVKSEIIKISNRVSPKSLPNSTILNWQLLDIIWEWLPDRLIVSEPMVLFSMSEDGNSLSTFYSKAGNHEPTLLVVKTLKNEIFGAFCSTAWSQRLGVNDLGCKNKYFGTGETFLFKLHPTLAYYPWIGALDSVKLINGFNKTKSNASLNNLENLKENENLNINITTKSLPINCQLFMCGERKYICIGSGGGNALWLDENLTRGRSEKCLTFNNEPLVEKGDFICGNVELIGFK